MCLDRLATKKEARSEDFNCEKTEDGLRKGYKVFRRVHEMGEVVGLFGRPYAIRKWVHEKEADDAPKVRTILSDVGVFYPKGFHIYVTEKGAKKWCTTNEYVTPVMFKNVARKGYQNGHPIIVAREIYVL